MAIFTEEELQELAWIDAEIDSNFLQTAEEIAESRKRDMAAKLSSMEPEARKIAEAQRAYRAAHKDKIAEAKRAYYAAHKDKIAEAKRAYYAAHKDEIAEAHRAYYAAHKDEIACMVRTWQIENRERWNAYQREYRARKRAMN